jgi:cation diffusion facilitator CzcD-associated flavoprotein CzcO
VQGTETCFCIWQADNPLRNTKWSRFYSGAPEIWQYLKDVATNYDLEKYVKFNTKVESAKWDEENGVWRLDLVKADGTHFEDTCEILVNGSGVLKLVLPDNLL